MQENNRNCEKYCNCVDCENERNKNMHKKD